MFYGWIIVAISSLVVTIVFGVRLSFSIFFVALIEDFAWSRADTSLIFSTTMIVFAITSTLTGIGLDRWGARWTFGIGAAILSVGLILSSRIHSLAQLTLAYGGIAGLGITLLGLGPMASVIARWFKKRRGMAIGITFAGTGVGSIFIIPGIEMLISAYSWRTAYLALAGLTIAMLPLIIIFLRLDPRQKNLLPDGESSTKNWRAANKVEKQWKLSETIKSPAFWLLMVAALGALGPIRMLTVHQVAIIVEAGFERSTAAEMVGLSGVFISVAFISLGILSDKIDRRFVYLFGSVSLIGAIWVLYELRSPDQSAWLLAYTVLLGIGEGSRSSLVTAFASDLFPGNSLGAINGAIGGAFAIGAAFLPWLAGFFYDLQGNYVTGFFLAVGVIIISSCSLWIAPFFLRNTA